MVQSFNALASLLRREFTSSDLFGHLLKSTIALFVVLNPIGTVPLFIAITQNMKKEERKAVSKTAIITSGTFHFTHTQYVLPSYEDCSTYVCTETLRLRNSYIVPDISDIYGI